MNVPLPVRQPISPALQRVITAQIGRSVEGRPLEITLFGEHQSPVLFLAGIHGNEQNSSGLAALLANYLRENPAIWREQSVAILPCANPDGTSRGIRTNGHKVDLNRNFAASNWAKSGWKGPYFGGDTPGSEPETQVLIELIQRLQPSRIVSIHSIATEPCDNWDGPAEELARAMSAANGYPVKATIGYPTPGSLGSWAGIDRGIATITLELPYGLPAADCWVRNREALLTVIGWHPPLASCTLLDVIKCITHRV